MNKSLTIYDTRNLLLNIMIKKCGIDSLLADYCLEHSQKKVIDHYLDYTYKDKKKAYKKYWKLIRKNIK